MKPLILDKQGKLITEYTKEELAFFQGWPPMSFPTEKDVQESMRVSTKIKAAVSQCWFNARRVVLRMDDYGDASYVEGWAIVFGALAMEHGWVVNDNTIIDPTLPADGGLYFPGLEFKGRAEIDEFLETSVGVFAIRTNRYRKAPSLRSNS